jgi:hypothetical protein
MKARRKKKLTPRQRIVVRELASDPAISTRDAMRTAGYAETSVRGHTAGRLSKAIAGTLKGALESAGLTDEALASRLAKVVNARKVTRAQHAGKFGDRVVDDDLPTSRAGIELACKLRGDLVDRVQVDPPEQEEYDLSCLTDDELRTLVAIQEKCRKAKGEMKRREEGPHEGLRK